MGGRHIEAGIGAILLDRLDREDVAQWLDELASGRAFLPAQRGDLPHRLEGGTLWVMYAGSAAAMLVVEPRGGRAVPAAARLGERRLGSKRGGRVSEVAMRGSEGTVAERIEAGRARRELAPRASHADYSPSPSRPDPIESLQDQAKDHSYIALAGLWGARSRAPP